MAGRVPAASAADCLIHAHVSSVAVACFPCMAWIWSCVNSAGMSRFSQSTQNRCIMIPLSGSCRHCVARTSPFERSVGSTGFPRRRVRRRWRSAEAALHFPPSRGGVFHELILPRFSHYLLTGGRDSPVSMRPADASEDTVCERGRIRWQLK